MRCGSARGARRLTVSRALIIYMLLLDMFCLERSCCLDPRSVSACPARFRAVATRQKKALPPALQIGVVLWFALVVLEYRLRKTLAQRRVVQVSAGREFLAPIDERRAQDTLRLADTGAGVLRVGCERPDARAIRPRDRFQCTRARPQLSPTRLVYAQATIKVVAAV